MIRGLSYVSDGRRMIIVMLSELGPRQSKLFEAKYKSKDYTFTSGMKEGWIKVPLKVKSYSETGVGPIIMKNPPEARVQAKTASIDQLKKFDFKEHPVTVFLDQHGDPWFFFD